LSPVQAKERYFVLTPLPNEAAAGVESRPIAIGVGTVKIPSYLFNTAFAVRDGSNEVDYSREALWAERLDTGMQRVLAANLSSLIPTDKVRLTSWRVEDVAVEVHVNVEQFDVDSKGRAVLSAWWRVVPPGGEQPVKSTLTRLTREGPAPGEDPGGAVATLSGLVGELSREVAGVVGTVPLQTSTRAAVK
jgi:uncharacterized lipoprotein YmbA